jgi:hypothetical protein
MTELSGPRSYLKDLEVTYANLLKWNSPLAYRVSTARELLKVRRYIAKIEAVGNK